MIASFEYVQVTNAQVRVEAAAGNPFGVARVTIRLRPQVDRSIVDSNGYSIRSAQNRVFYPTFSSGRIIGIVKQLLDPIMTDVINQLILRT